MTDFVNSIIDVVSGGAKGILGLLPVSPFSAVEVAIDPVLLRYLNYFLPIKEFMNVGAAWLLSIGLYYVIMIFMRWYKVIQ